LSKILVTGGCGFIGSHIVRSLLNNMHEVRVLDNLKTGKLERLNGLSFEFIKGGINDPHCADEATKGIDAIFHLAALISVPESLQNPVEYERVNVGGTLRLLDAAVANGVKRFIFSSSCAIYGDLPDQHEKAGFSPTSPYALNKLCAEMHVGFYHRYYNIKCISLRYFNVFGEGQDPSSPYAAVIPKFLEIMKNGQCPTVFGDGTQTRDFCHVSNITHANLLALTSDNLNGGAINIGSGSAISVAVLVDYMNRVLGTNISPIFGAEREGDIKHSVADLTRAKQLLGYTPAVEFLEGLQRLAIAKLGE
jgi:nucleoside-diphosphate-sugar epimerase